MMPETLRLTLTQALIKRTLDLLLTCVCLMLIAPVLLAVSMGVKLSSPGPIIYRYKRFGSNGKPVYVYKFRTMMMTESQDVARWTTKSDPRITRFGAFLRRTALDELPSFVNVLRGDMSIVGPRPKHAYEFEYFKAISTSTIELRPGITFPSRGRDYASSPDEPETIRVLYEQELAYVQEWSVLLDLRVIGKTIHRAFFASNAY